MKDELEQKKTELQKEFDKLKLEREQLLILANTKLEKMIELRGGYRVVDELLNKHDQNKR